MQTQDTPDPFNQLRPEIHELRGLKALCALALGTLLRLYLSTLRFKVDASSGTALKESNSPRVIVVWHNRSLVIPIVFYRLLEPERIHCLISPSRMAAWEVSFFKRFRLRSIRGSSTRRSVPSAMEMLRALKRGEDVGISPDGPSGPLYSVKPGALTIARRAHVPLLLLIPNAKPAIRLKTWDRHLLPLPFARLDIRATHVPAELLKDLSQNEAAERIRTLCLELTEDSFKKLYHE